jgi:hypothetical protein
MPKVKTRVAAKKVERKRRLRGSGKFPSRAVRFPPELMARIERYAKAQGISWSEALRELAIKGLDK